MRLRYLHIRHYPPLDDVELVPGPPALLERECAIRFVVGVNGSGKTHLLQAVAETFLALARQRPPHFPITLIYELGEGERNRLLIFKGRGPGREPRWWQSTRSAHEIASKGDSTDYGLCDWQALLSNVKEDTDSWQPLIQQGNWPGEGVGLPQVVLAYTTGCIDPWRALFHSEPEAGDVDIVSQSDEYEVTERPAGWNRQRELDYLSAQPDAESRAQHQTLQRLAEENRAKVQEQQLCHLLDPVLLKFALLAVTLRQAMEDYRTYASDGSATAVLRSQIKIRV